VLIINKVQVFLPIKCLPFLNVHFNFKFKFHNSKLNLNSLFMFRVCLFKSNPSPQLRDQKRSCQILSHFESVPSPRRRETRSLLGFSDKSVKKSRNFRCYVQKPSNLPRNCPACWDVTDFPLNKNFVLKFGVRCTFRILDRLSLDPLLSPRLLLSPGDVTIAPCNI
jgi:hypothetical protein